MSAILQNGRWFDLNTRLEIDLELFIALSHLIHPSPLHRTHLPVTTSPQLRAAVLQAANIACTVLNRMVCDIDMSAFRSNVSSGLVNACYQSSSGDV